MLLNVDQPSLTLPPFVLMAPTWNKNPFFLAMVEDEKLPPHPHPSPWWNWWRTANALCVRGCEAIGKAHLAILELDVVQAKAARDLELIPAKLQQVWSQVKRFVAICW